MNLCDINTVRSLLEKHGFRFSKAMGQNFLIESWVPQEIAAASGAAEDHAVLEIGPGIGPLTQQLCRRAGKVVAVELDRTLFPILSETLGEFDNFELVEGDILKTDIPSLVDEKLMPLRPIVCANLPYNITSPVLTELARCKRFESLTVLIQREVALRIAAKPGTADYGAFSLLMQYYTEPSVLFDVPNTCFVPAPKVTSSVLHCVCRTVPPIEVDEPFFFRTVRGGFALRRKTLVNSLTTEFGSQLDKGEIADCITRTGLAPDIRGERLGLEEYAALSHVLKDAVQRR